MNRIKLAGLKRTGFIVFILLSSLKSFSQEFDLFVDTDAEADSTYEYYDLSLDSISKFPVIDFRSMNYLNSKKNGVELITLTKSECKEDCDFDLLIERIKSKRTENGIFYIDLMTILNCCALSTFDIEIKSDTLNILISNNKDHECFCECVFEFKLGFNSPKVFKYNYQLNGKSIPFTDRAYAKKEIRNTYFDDGTIKTKTVYHDSIPSIKFETYFEDSIQYKKVIYYNRNGHKYQEFILKK